MLGSSVLVTLVLALAVIRWLAPGLLGVSQDLQLVRTREALPPFYDGAFRADDYASPEFQLNDPVTVVRPRPGFSDLGGIGPHDILGFRNRAVPNFATIVVIGDSQTYGNNAPLEEAWPSRLEAHLADKEPLVYSMAAGGWGAVQYLEMFTKATSFAPQLVIVAYYTGNDPRESVRVAYAVERWASLRPTPSLDVSGAPSPAFPPPESEQWPVTFPDGVATIFTPDLRLASNVDHPVVAAGYELMAGAAREMGRLAAGTGIRLLFTIIPTKELVYAEKIRREQLDPPAKYRTLVKRESRLLGQLAATLAAVPQGEYVDLLRPLQEAALQPHALYPASNNGHPNAAGYDLIAKILTVPARKRLPDRPQGLVAMMIGRGQYQTLLVKDSEVWRFHGPEHAAANGWPVANLNGVLPRDLAGLTWRGTVPGVDRDRFGPEELSSGKQPIDHRGTDERQGQEEQ
jgi:lysophospholipase L1-like esterase